jgi:HD-like signal output (HDOD) protein
MDRHGGSISLETATPLPLTTCAKELAAQHASVFVRLSKLPPLRPAALKLLNLSSESNARIQEFEAIFRSDPALTADLLLVANSAEFGPRARIDNIKHAITFLGMERVRSLGSTIAFGYFVRQTPRQACIRSIWVHSVATAVVAEAIGNGGSDSGSYTAGLMHDLGRLGLFLGSPKYSEVLATEFGDVQEANALEKELFGMTHCEAGAHVARTWRFSSNLQSCMLAHHDASELESGGTRPIVQTACRMAEALGYPEFRRREPLPPPTLPERLSRRPELAPERLQERIAIQIAVTGG